jgi:hypothetical protein
MSTSVLKFTPTAQDRKALKRQRKQISRIIKHLRDQLTTPKHLSSVMSDAFIDQLIDYALEDIELNHNDWHKTIYKTLQLLIIKMSQHNHTTFHTYTYHSLTSIALPIKQWEIKVFALRLLQEIDAGSIYFKEE